MTTTHCVEIANTTDKQLNWLVAEYLDEHGLNFDYVNHADASLPLLEDSQISIHFDKDRVFDEGEVEERWYAEKPFEIDSDVMWTQYGSSMLRAGLRCFLEVKLGSSPVTVPESLVNGPVFRNLAEVGRLMYNLDLMTSAVHADVESFSDHPSEYDANEYFDTVLDSALEAKNLVKLLREELSKPEEPNA